MGSSSLFKAPRFYGIGYSVPLNKTLVAHCCLSAVKGLLENFVSYTLFLVIFLFLPCNKTC